jgi:hypothetical protein
MPFAGFAVLAGVGAGTGFGARLGGGWRSMNGRRSGSATAAATAADPLANTPRGIRAGRLERAAVDDLLERAAL